jgi:general secretion pathway protein H
MRRAHRSSIRGGFSLIEIMVVIVILALATGAAIFGLRSAGKTGLRGNATQLGSAIRYCYDRAITTNSYYRMVLDFDGNTYWAERSDDRMLLGREKEKSPGKGQAFDQETADKDRDKQVADDDERMRERGQGLGIALEPPPHPKRAKFQTFNDAAIKKMSLGKDVRLFDVYTPRQREPYKKGKAYLYFFPDGHTERALIHLSEGDNFFSLMVSPLTGRVDVKSGKLEPERDFDTKGQER